MAEIKIISKYLSARCFHFKRCVQSSYTKVSNEEKNNPLHSFCTFLSLFTCNRIDKEMTAHRESGLSPVYELHLVKLKQTIKIFSVPSSDV